MANFYTDNEDIQFLFEHMDVRRLAAIQEEDFRFADQFDFTRRALRRDDRPDGGGNRRGGQHAGGRRKRNARPGNR